MAKKFKPNKSIKNTGYPIAPGSKKNVKKSTKKSTKK